MGPLTEPIPPSPRSHAAHTPAHGDTHLGHLLPHREARTLAGSQTHTKAHARTESHLESRGDSPHSSPAQLRAGSVVRRCRLRPGAHDGPAPRLQTFRSSPRTDLQKHFDNHLPRGLTPPPRAGPGTPEGAAAKPPPRLLRTGNLSRPAGSSAGGNLARR